MTFEGGADLFTTQVKVKQPVFIVKPESLNASETIGIHPVATKPVKASPDRESASDIFEMEPDTDSKFPLDGIKYFVKVIAPKSDQTAKEDLAFRTQTAGRADYRFPYRMTLKNKEGSRMSVIMTKGSGSERAVEMTKSPFCKKLAGTDEPTGMASLYDLKHDAQNSKLLDENGLRARLCLGVYQIEEIEYEGKVYTPEEFMKAGFVSKAEDLPGIGVFAVRTPYKVEDLRNILKDYRLDDPAIGNLINHLLETTENDDAPEFSAFFSKYHSLSESGFVDSTDQRRNILLDFSYAFARVMGRQAAGFEKLKAAKTTLGGKAPDSMNNFTILAESVDNVGVVRNASIQQIYDFQKYLLTGLTGVFPTILATDPGKLVDIEVQTIRHFLDGYLDAMAPDWQKIVTENSLGKFITNEANNLDADQTDIVRAYWITKLKHDAIANDATAPVTRSNIEDATFGLLVQIFRDQYMGEKTSNFLRNYSAKFGVK